MNFVVKLLWIRQRELILPIRVMLHPHKVVVPGPTVRNHEEPEEPVTEEHLDLLVVGREVALGIVPLVSILPTPLEPTEKGQGLVPPRSG